MTDAIFLDRDGIINRALVRGGRPFSPANMEEFAWVEGIHEATEQLKAAGYLLFCVTNQPDVGRGLQLQSTVEELHQRIMEELPLEKIYTCYHDDAEGCRCRKPRPGMILAAKDEYGLDLNRSWLVGDRWKDIDAGSLAGCQTVFIDYYYDEALKITPDHTILELKDLPSLILGSACKRVR